VFAALRLIRAAGLQNILFPRLRILNLAPAHFLLPSDYPETSLLQFMNLVKLEDKVINPWATNFPRQEASTLSNVIVVQHRQQTP